MNNERILTCVYCGHEYPQNTPTSNSEVLTEHIKICEKHPMRKLEQDNQKLKKSLLDFVGVSTKKELEDMETILRLMPMPGKDKIITLNAIHVLIDTL